MRRLFLVIVDAALLFAAALTATQIRYGNETTDILFNQRGWMKIVMLAVVIQLAFYLFDLYDLPATKRYRQVIINMVIALGVASILLSIFSYVMPVLQLGRGVLLVAVILILAAVPAWRLVVAWSAGHSELGVRERVLILGSGSQAIELARATLERRTSGFYIVGFVDNKPELIGKSLINPKVIGLTKDIGSLVDQYEIDRIVVAVADRRGMFPTEELLNLSLSGRVAVEESARYYERLTGRIDSEMLRPSWLIFARRNRFSDFEHHVRRVLNVGFAAVGLLMSLPIMLLTALAVKLESRGPIFYIQERVGKNGRTFKIIKFRSMRVGAEAKSGPVWAEEDDPRVTRVGRVIRKLRFDELPQFVNVIRGQMNFVGPRPERPVFVEQLGAIVPYYSQRHVVKPGLTGWAQIKYPYGASIEDAIEKLRYDLYYIKNQTLLLDAVIVFETIKIVVFGRGGR